LETSIGWSDDLNDSTSTAYISAKSSCMSDLESLLTSSDDVYSATISISGFEEASSSRRRRSTSSKATVIYTADCTVPESKSTDDIQDSVQDAVDNADPSQFSSFDSFDSFTATVAETSTATTTETETTEETYQSTTEVMIDDDEITTQGPAITTAGQIDDEITTQGPAITTAGQIDDEITTRGPEITTAGQIDDDTADALGEMGEMGDDEATTNGATTSADEATTVVPIVTTAGEEVSEEEGDALAEMDQMGDLMGDSEATTASTELDNQVPTEAEPVDDSLATTPAAIEEAPTVAETIASDVADSLGELADLGDMF